MLRARLLTVFVFVAYFFLLLTSQAFCDVAPGDVIDKTNWEKVEGLLPEAMLNWVKDGKVVLHIGKLNYNPDAHHPAFALETLKTNIGKYALDENDGIAIAKTGKRPKSIVGFPFPEIDVDEPKAATKMLYNKDYIQYIAGNARAVFKAHYINRSGYSRSTVGAMINMVMDGNPKSAARSNPDRIEKYQIFVARSPYDIAGSAIMTWRYFCPRKEDNTFTYLPAIRRVRRMSPGNRSDCLFGSDMSVDDASCYDGKVTAMEWKLLRKQEALLPYNFKDPGRLVKNEYGEWESSENIKKFRSGFEKEGWQGAHWAPLDWVWVKQHAYVIEMKAKDPYYNYGPQELWVYQGNWLPHFKIINDRAGKYWKAVAQAMGHFESRDKEFKLTYAGEQAVIDERAAHATLISGPTPTDIWQYDVEMDEDDFSLAGFQKFCK
jgi:hypothetical protein